MGRENERWRVIEREMGRCREEEKESEGAWGLWGRKEERDRERKRERERESG